jgi:hypothetical protein
MSLSDSTRSVQIVAGSSSVKFTAPNLFTYQFPASGFKSLRDEVALKSLTLYFSWANISALKGNNSYSYIWGNQSYPVVMADGIFTFADFYLYLQQVMRANGHYLIDDNGMEQFYLNLFPNQPLYCLTLQATPVPTALPTNWANPGNVDFSTAGGKTPQLIISAGVSTFTGFAAGMYPTAPATTTQYINSGVPQVTDSTALNVLCNLVDNSGFSLSPNILTSFVMPQKTAAGDLLQIQPNNLDWVPIRQDTYSTITLELVDQLRRPLVIRDPAGFVAVLSLRKR